jgi:hypothetical protein
LYHGKPIYKIIPRDEETINLIGMLVDFLYDCFSGLASPSEFPYHLIGYYAGAGSVVEEVNFDEDDKALATELYGLRLAAKMYDPRINELETYFKSKFKNVKYDADQFSVSITTSTRKGGLDIDAIKMDYPTLNEDKYKMPDSEYTTLRFAKKKPK